MSWNGWGIWGSQAGRGTWVVEGRNQSTAGATPKQSKPQAASRWAKALLERPQEVKPGCFA